MGMIQLKRLFGSLTIFAKPNSKGDGKSPLEGAISPYDFPSCGDFSSLMQKLSKTRLFIHRGLVQIIHPYSVSSIIFKLKIYLLMLSERITINPKILFGKPSIYNKRYSVTLILDLLSAGMTTKEILEDYEDLEEEDILACLLFTAKLAEVKSIQKLALA